MSQTINLLPPAYQRVTRLNRLAPLAELWILIGIVSLGVTWAVIHTSRQAVEAQATHLTSQLGDQQSAREFDALSSQVTSLASLAGNYQLVFSKDRAWEELFNYLEQTVPANVSISSLTTAPAAGSNYLITINGKADNQRSVGAFRESLLSYRSQPSQPERISQVVITSISADATSNQQTFSLQATMDLSTKPASK